MITSPLLYPPLLWYLSGPFNDNGAPRAPRAPALQHSSGSVSVTEEGGSEGTVKLRKSKKGRKRSSMIFISEERERTSTLDSKRVREEHMAGEISRRQITVS